MGWSLRKLLGRAPFDIAVRQSYIATVEQARQPYFYESWSVPDTVIGRFDMIALHCFLVLFDAPCGLASVVWGLVPSLPRPNFPLPQVFICNS